MEINTHTHGQVNEVEAFIKAQGADVYAQYTKTSAVFSVKVTSR